MIDLSPLVAAPGPRSLPYFDPSFPDRMLILHAARPREWKPGHPVLFVHHGVARNGQDYRDYWLPHVDASGALVISIEFPEASFPEYLWYNFGNLHTADGRPNPRDQWTFGIDPRLFDALRDQGITRTRRYGVFGHSAAANMSIACCHSDTGIAWPWPSPPTPEHMRCLTCQSIGPGALERLRSRRRTETFLGFPITIMAGTEDTKTTGRFFPKGPKSLRQGPTRFARAHRYLQTGQEAAAQLGVSLAWRVVEVPGVGHDGRGMSDAAAPLVADILRRAGAIRIRLDVKPTALSLICRLLSGG